MTEGFQPPGPEAKVFVISVAAELSGLHPQTLRTYDRLGLVAPGRAGDGAEQLDVAQGVAPSTAARLTAEGLGLEGVKRVIDLENQVLALQAKVAELQAELAQSSQVQNLPALIADNQVVIWRTMRR
jgi:MerR family transcriptional regulator/heat shock protein HspR